MKPRLKTGDCAPWRSGLRQGERRWQRYFTLTHLHNAGLSAEELQSYRHGVSKLLNSLSWEKDIVVPKSVDAARTILRIDVRDYQWTEKTWECILEKNPYRSRLTSAAAKRVCATILDRG